MEEKYISLWDKSAEENDYAGHVETTRDADVIVVGGGFTGLSTAYHGAKLGLDIHVLEANKICLLYTSPSPRDLSTYRMPSSA